jgi:predicted metalloprotease with PDZ domain
MIAIKQTHIPTLLFLFISSLSFGQEYKYSVNLTDSKKDKVKVELKCPSLNQDTVYFNFPMTVPGTYDILNYGNYISNFKAFDADKNELKIVRTTINTFKIFPAKKIHSISYTVRDSWDSKEKKHKIFEPAGIGFEANEYFYINNGGLFGFFDNTLLIPFQLEFKKPAHLDGYTSLQSITKTAELQSFTAANYHDLIDNPILFTKEKAENMKISNADIVVASYYKGADSSAINIKEKLDSSLLAIGKFIGGPLPITSYNFLNYIVDLKDVGKIIMQPKIKLYQYPKLILKTRGQGFGALEHGNSSSYYLPDFGHDSYCGMVSGTAIHEFMHIYAPLSLHSVDIGNFDYVHPKMSKHLWLYEGVTEYFATIISMQGNLESVENTIHHSIKEKIVNSYAYPDSIPFTEMSENVFNPPYKAHYGQVYERGAIMAMLLDFEIMKLTNGEKTLKTVIFELIKIYGKNKSFQEDEIIPVFVKLVHPDLQVFFDKYVSGTAPLDIEGGFKIVGINFKKTQKGKFPIDLLSAENGVTANMNIVVNNSVNIKAATKDNKAGIMKGDKVNRDAVVNCFKNANGEFVKEGEIIKLDVIRNKKTVTLSFPAEFKEGEIKNVLEIAKDKNALQERFFNIWTTGLK